MRKLTISQLKNLLNQPESEWLDFKQDYSKENIGLIKDLLSLANARTHTKN